MMLSKLLLNNLIYPVKRFQFHNCSIFTVLLIIISCSYLFFITPVYAEGSYDLIKSGNGYRPYLVFGDTSALTDIMAYDTKIKVFVNQGEQVNLGSSVPESYTPTQDILWRSPSGATDSCDVKADTKVGFIENTTQEQNGPATTGGYTPCTFTAHETGIYEITFHSPEQTKINNPSPITVTQNFPTDATQDVAIAAWDVTVFTTPNDPDTKQIGRVYANYLPLYPGNPGQENTVRSELYIQSQVGHTYTIGLNGIDPGWFIFFANNKGFTDNNLINPLFQSVEQNSAKFHHPGQPDDDNKNNITHKIFFNEPADDLPSTNDNVNKTDWIDSPSGLTWLRSNPPPSPTTQFQFTGSDGTANQTGTTGPQGGTFTINSNQSGNAIVTIKVDGAEKDRTLIGSVIANTNSAMNWDGLDGEGNPLAVGDYEVKLLFNTNEVHFPFLDVENSSNGLIIKRTGDCPLCDTVYFNDQELGGEKELDGTSSSGGAHQFSNNFGDRKGIDTWTSITAEDQLTLSIKQVDLVIEKSHSSPCSAEIINPSSLIEYTIEIENKDGSSNVTGIQVDDDIPHEITEVTWTCRVEPETSGNSCAQVTGSGNNIDTTIDLKNGAKAIFTIQGVISNQVTTGQQINNMVTIATPDVTNLGDTTAADGGITISNSTPVNQPNAQDDNIEGIIEGQKFVNINILENDGDNLDKSSVVITKPLKKGSVQLTNNGTARYTPNSDWSGTDDFKYRVCNNECSCNWATVTLKVDPRVDPPPPPPPVELAVTIEGQGLVQNKSLVKNKSTVIDCHNNNGDCLATFKLGDWVELIAKPDPDWQFQEWQQDCDEGGKENPTQVRLTKMLNQCQAVFVPILSVPPEPEPSQPLNLDVSITGSGSVTAINPEGGIVNCESKCSSKYPKDTSVTLSATPAEGWRLEDWHGHCKEQGGKVTLDTDKHCRAIFVEDEPDPVPPASNSPFKVTVSKIGLGTVSKIGLGNVISEPSGIDCDVTCSTDSADFDGSSSVRLLATPEPGWKLEIWRGHCDQDGQVIKANISYNHAQCKVIFSPVNCEGTCPGKDDDQDGVPNSIEDAAPNSGDGNNDGTPDSQQNNVISISESEQGQYVTVEESNGCIVDNVQMNDQAAHTQQAAAAPIDLELSCSQAQITNYYHGISDLTGTPHFQAAPSNDDPTIIEWQPLPVEHDTVMIQGQPVATESFSLSDGDVGDSIPGDGKITHTSGRAPLSVPPTPEPVSGQVQFSAERYPVNEAEPTFTIQVQRQGGCDGPIQVNYTTQAGIATEQEDFVPASGTLTWNDGDCEDKPVTITLQDDKLLEGNETVMLQLLPNNDITTIGSPSEAVLIIIDDEVPPSSTPSLPHLGQVQFSAAHYTVNETESSFTARIQRQGGCDGPIQANYTTQAGTATEQEDFVPASGTLTWNDGDCEDKFVTIILQDDELKEDDETIKLVLSNENSTGIGSPSEAILTIIDNEKVCPPIPSPPILLFQTLQVGKTASITFDSGQQVLFIETMPNPNLVTVSGNGSTELTLTGLGVGKTSMIVNSSLSSQQMIVDIKVTPAPRSPEPEEKIIPEIIKVGQSKDLTVSVGQGVLSIAEMPDPNLVSLSNWQQKNGIADFTLTGRNIGNATLIINDSTIPPQKTQIDITIKLGEPALPPSSCQGDTLGIDLQDRTHQACFIGKVISRGDLRSATRALTHYEAQQVRVSATILIAPEDIGKVADILLIGMHTQLNGKSTLYFREDSRYMSSWKIWNGQINLIPAAQYYPQLPETTDIFIFEGDLSAWSGEFTVFVGYRLLDGTIIYNGLNPIHFCVDKKACIN